MMADDNKHRNVTPATLANWHRAPVEEQIKVAWPEWVRPDDPAPDDDQTD